MSHCTKGFNRNGYEIVGVFEMRILHLFSMLGFPGIIILILLQIILIKINNHMAIIRIIIIQ